MRGCTPRRMRKSVGRAKETPVGNRPDVRCQRLHLSPPSDNQPQTPGVRADAGYAHRFERVHQRAGIGGIRFLDIGIANFQG